jgi:hypothetical protein
MAKVSTGEWMSAFPSTVNWPDSRRGPWRVTCWWASVDGYARLIGVDVRSFAGSDGPDLGESVETLTASILRRLPLDAVAGRAFEQGKNQLEPLFVGPGDVTLLTGTFIPGGKTGRRPLSPDDLARVAAVYRAGGTKPTQAVAKAFGITVSAAGKRVARARRAGLLDPTTQGRAGGPPIARKRSRGKP